MTASFVIGQADVIASDFHTNGLCKLAISLWNLWSPILFFAVDEENLHSY